MKNWKKVGVIIGVVVAVFLLFNVVRHIYIYEQLGQYQEALGGADSFFDGEYTYYVGYPRWPEWNGNLSITGVFEHDDKKEYMDEDVVDLLIWPSAFGRYIIEVGIYETSKHTGSEDDPYEEISLRVDEHMKLLEPTEENVALYNAHIDKIRHVFSLAYEKWGILKQ